VEAEVQGGFGRVAGRAVPVGQPLRRWGEDDPAALAVRVALLRRAVERGEQPAYAVAGLLDSVHAAQIATLGVVARIERAEAA
jgi:hypothetical protein